MKNVQQFIVSSFFVLGIFFIATHQGLAQRAIPPKPTLETAVYDEAKMLSGSEAEQLEKKLIQYADTTSTQIVVATINSLQGENIGLYAAEWAHEWGIGQKKEDNGVFILVSQMDRKIWIATGYGVEEKLTDFTSKTIIDQIITPEFKKGKFYTGLDEGITAIFQVLDGTFKGAKKKKSRKDFPIGQLALLLIFFIIIVKAFSKSNHGNGGKGNRGNRSRGGSLLDAIILSNMGRGSYGGGSFGGGSSGGFGGGFGGGGFGGGGAGGSW
ncbi:TPM domain-containing protein [Aquimarina celericrescens]|uniref:TPM domain-containing protein n=1 Tax=Aquimarina celericrescens TaxID=1964542 RepID=A0ABW5AV49_9FLAO|nr:TPM domain-containing protein [Aquimarina celericrescens]